MKQIYQELARIQQELKAPKNLYNSFGKYAYRNAEGILEAVKPLLGGKLVLLINDEPLLIGDRFYIKATVTLTDGEESVSAVAYAREDETKKGMDGCQITGACSSYARKYALNALLMIDDSKDSDDDSLSPKNPKNSAEAPPQSSQKGQGGARVTTSSTVPPVQKNVTQTAQQGETEPKPETVYLQAYIEKFTRDYGDDEKHSKFYRMRSALVQGKLIPDKKVTMMTKEEIDRMMQRIYEAFPREAAS